MPDTLYDTRVQRGDPRIEMGRITVLVRGNQTGLPQHQQSGAIEEWRLRVQAALNEARDLRLKGDAHANERGAEAMSEYRAFVEAVGIQNVEIFHPLDEEPQPRLTARRRIELRDSRRLFRDWRKSGFEQQSMPTAVPA